jgi:hypothetical protein
MIFEDEEDCFQSLETLQRYKKSGYEVYTYCLMGNKVHLLIEYRGIMNRSLCPQKSNNGVAKSDNVVTFFIEKSRKTGCFVLAGNLRKDITGKSGRG